MVKSQKIVGIFYGASYEKVIDIVFSSLLGLNGKCGIDEYATINKW